MRVTWSTQLVLERALHFLHPRDVQGVVTAATGAGLTLVLRRALVGSSMRASELAQVRCEEPRGALPLRNGRWEAAPLGSGTSLRSLNTERSIFVCLIVGIVSARLECVAGEDAVVTMPGPSPTETGMPV